MDNFTNERRLALKKLSALIALALFSGNSRANVVLHGDNFDSTGVSVKAAFPDFSTDDIIEDFKLSLAFALHYVPYIGDILSFLVHLLWPSSQKDIWEEIREKVEKLIDQKLSEDTYERLKQVLEGLEGVLKQYLKTIQAGASDDEIKIHFLAANLFFINQRPWFQQKNHEYVLYPLFSIFASLHLTLLRDGLINGKHLFSNNEYELLKKDMKEYTKSYSDYLLKTVDAERYKLKEHSPPVGQHKTEYYNYFADFNAVTIKYCDDYIEMFRQMDVDLNPQAFEFDRTQFKDIFSKAYGTADDWDGTCRGFARGGMGVQSIYTQPAESFNSIFLDFFDGRPVNLNIAYPDGKGPYNLDKHRVNSTQVIADYHRGVETRTVAIEAIDGEIFPISSVILKSGSIPSHLTLFDTNGKSYNLWNSYEAFQQEEVKVSFAPRRLSTITAWSHSRYYHYALGCMILGFSWVPPKNKTPALLRQHYKSMLTEPDLDELSRIHHIDALDYIKPKDESQRDQYWSELNDIADKNQVEQERNGGAIGGAALTGLIGSVLLKRFIK